jgi:hypothetical protein
MNLNVPRDPKYWERRAEEAWAVAEQMTNAHTRAVMVGIAQGYEKIVVWAAEDRARRER